MSVTPSSPVTTWNDRFQLVTAAAAALAAFVSVLVLVGAVVLAGQLKLYSLPWVVVLTQIPQTFLASLAVVMVVAPLLAIGATYALIALAFHLVHGSLTPTPPEPSLTRRLVGWLLRPFRPVAVPPSGRITIDWGLVLWAALWTFVGLVIMLAAHHFGYATPWDAGRIAIAALTAVLGWAPSSVLLEAVRNTEADWRAHTHLLMVSTFMALAFLPLLSWNAMTLPLPYATVCATKNLPAAGGWLIGQAGDTLILGSVEEPRHIVVAPSKDAQILETTYTPTSTTPLPTCA